jgi:Co/Zn/Cd efflux system component
MAMAKKALDIRRDPCPLFLKKTSLCGQKKKGLTAPVKPTGQEASRVAYFAGCSAGYLFPAVAKAAASLLEQNGQRKIDTMRSHTEATPHQIGHTGECSGHHHAIDVQETSGTRLLITLVLNLIIPVVQIIAGIFAHSMALISDATHNFSDFTAILISYIAFRIGKKGASDRQTFGYRRAEIMAALLNVTILTGACIFILYGALQRFLSPEIVSGHIVIWAALVGIIGNDFSAWLLHQDAKRSGPAGQ